jgi:chemotaxis protein MotB
MKKNMITQKMVLLLALFGCTLIWSCGPSKKLKAANLQIEQLQSQNGELNKTVGRMKNEMVTLNSSNRSMGEELDRFKSKYREVGNKLEETQAILKEQEETLHRIEEKIKTAMVDFEDKGLSVEFRIGLIFLNLEEQLLYRSGSSRLGDNGKKVLASLAGVLADYPNLKAVILGNTDSVLFKKGNDNWTLSTERANGVVRILRDEYKVDPSRLTAAGKGKYNPIADNGTPEGRAKNRRTEIILNPDLTKIWDSIEH